MAHQRGRKGFTSSRPPAAIAIAAIPTATLHHVSDAARKDCLQIGPFDRPQPAWKSHRRGQMHPGLRRPLLL